MKAVVGSVKNYIRRLRKENPNLPVTFGFASVNIPLTEEGKVKPSRRGEDFNDNAKGFIQEDLRAILSFYNSYEAAKEIVFCESPYVETVPLRKGGAGFEYGFDVEELSVRFLKAKYSPPVRIKSHCDHAVDMFKKLGRIKKKKDGEWENDKTVKVADWNIDKGEVVIQPAEYFDQVGTNLTLDWASGHLGDSASMTLRNDIERTVGGALPKLKDSVLANTLGVAVVLISRGEDVLIPIRGNEQAVMIDGKGKFHCSASGVFSWEDVDLDYNEIDFDFFIDGMAREIESELGLLKEDCSITPLAFSRELIRGGKPQLFFIAETDKSIDEIRVSMKDAEESWEFISEDELPENSPLRSHLDAPMQAPQELFTYEGWMALAIAMAYIRDEEPPFAIC